MLQRLELVQASLIPGTEFDFANQQMRRWEWQNTGRCRGLTQIGHFSVDQAVVEANIVPGADYNPLFERSDGGAEQLPLFTQIEEAFDNLVDDDLARMTPQTRANYDSSQASLLTAGEYIESIGDIHTDEGFGVNCLRYFVTLFGPATVGIRGKLGPECFTDNYDLKPGVRVPKHSLQKHVAGQVLRFVSDCEPHTPPICTEPQSRATIQKTVFKLANL